MNHLQARLELARRYLHTFGPATATSFARWSGVSEVEALDVFSKLSTEIRMVSTPIGDRWILSSDEALLFSRPNVTDSIRLLPSGDAFFLVWGDDRTLLVPNSIHSASLWTSRVWPGALLVGGELAGTWRRSAHLIAIRSWKHLTRTEKLTVEVEVGLLPVSDTGPPIAIRWV